MNHYTLLLSIRNFSRFHQQEEHNASEYVNKVGSKTNDKDMKLFNIKGKNY